MRFLKFLKNAETDQNYEETDFKFEPLRSKIRNEMDLRKPINKMRLKVFVKSGNGSKI